MKKTLTVFTLAGITTFSLFAFMTFLISSEQIGIVKGFPPVNIDVVW
jgi:hypothetical protein